jgi:hypothetical protein
LAAAASPCTMDHGVSHPSSAAVVSTAVSASSPAPEMTIAITNHYGSALSLSFGLDMSSPPPYSNLQPTVLLDSATIQYVYPDRWAGNVAIGPNLNPDGSKIKGSFINSSVDIDVSYIDGYTVPITCSSEGVAVTGCNLDLFQGHCKNQVNGPVCLNPARYAAYRPPTPFFAPCTGATYTFPHDDGANRDYLLSRLVSCCISTLCVVLSRQQSNTTT